MWENSNSEIFEGEPISKWKDIIFHASRTLANNELERLLEELALYELAFDEYDVEINMRDFYHKTHYDERFKQALKERKNSLAIESMSKILSENE
ncbi:DUF2018 domain-containing protein [Helicobacter aurati]|uniref:DUF2018 domain-containing protein n=1 Tax=Helicobacter aurati TaxID=137778 RepID=A0A3D8J4H2_9HELI|nr:DUF2018 family protein [Helicobacter aurati]RDU71661.1 DUF2018 domain-containing protein [Helicobacter aurati]